MKRLTTVRKIRGLDETAALAHALAAGLVGGEVLALEGDLGAGKTSFTRELTKALGCARLANSPTFALFQRYRGGRLLVLHGDFYRLSSPAELLDLGWEEMLDQLSNGLVVVEWANRFPEELPPDRLHMVWRLQPEDEDREVEIAASGPKSERLLAALAKDLVRNNFPVSSAEAPGGQGLPSAVSTDVHKPSRTKPSGMDSCSRPGSDFGPDPKDSPS
jgi:tRNA threonylcarbamoyladenosine biosynthesis protein TsaE